jgi:hypothetical protein
MAHLPQPPWRAPHPSDLGADPDLAPVTLLDAALLVSIETLLAFVPELDPSSVTWAQVPPDVLAARQLVVHARHLRALIDHYRHTLERRFSDDDEIPF